MRILFISLFALISFNLYASPYANPWLYDKMLDYINNPDAYSDNFTYGVLDNRSSDIIVGAYIEDAYSVYGKEEEYTPQFISCGDNCYQDNNSKDILETYHKFFYMYAIAFPVTSVLLQNPAKDDNISYYMQNKKITYTWKNDKELFINIDNGTLDFKQQNNGVIINSTMQALKNYILD